LNTLPNILQIYPFPFSLGFNLIIFHLQKDPFFFLSVFHFSFPSAERRNQREWREEQDNPERYFIFLLLCISLAFLFVCQKK
jgi:hypothetical protein